MPVHVSIHDVSPVWSDEIDLALELCAAVDARPALLVVPDFHGRAPILRDDRFCDRLRSLQAAGHEIYLHGFHHRALRPLHAPGWRQRIQSTFAQRVLSEHEAELEGVPEAQGRTLIAEGEKSLRAAGLRIDGFVAPAWAMPGWLLGALAERGYRFTEDHVRIYDPERRRSRVSVVLNWASRSPARLLSTVAWCRFARRARPLLPARIAIHPADMRVALLRGEVRSALRWARGDIVARGSSLL